MSEETQWRLRACVMKPWMHQAEGRGAWRVSTGKQGRHNKRRGRSCQSVGRVAGGRCSALTYHERCDTTVLGSLIRRVRKATSYLGLMLMPLQLNRVQRRAERACSATPQTNTKRRHRGSVYTICRWRHSKTRAACPSPWPTSSSRSACSSSHQKLLSL